MAELFVSPDSGFSFGRLFSDAGRVLARGWPVLAVGLLVLGVAPRVATGLPWWRVAVATPEAQRVALEVTMIKAAINLVASAALTTFVAAVSLKVLQASAWRETLAPAPLALGVATAVCVSLVFGWPSLIAPVVGRWLSPPMMTALAFSGFFVELALLPFLGVATLSAVAERRFVPSAFARSIRLLRGLRWRIAALGAGFIIALVVSQSLVQIGLAISGVPLSRGPGLARVALTLCGVLIGSLAGMMFASVFAQSRRIADGPTAGELHDVFA
jgi:hypothetical protein